MPLLCLRKLGGAFACPRLQSLTITFSQIGQIELSLPLMSVVRCACRHCPLLVIGIVTGEKQMKQLICGLLSLLLAVGCTRPNPDLEIDLDNQDGAVSISDGTVGEDAGEGHGVPQLAPGEERAERRDD